MNIAYKYLLYVCMATCFMQVGCTDEVHLNRDDGEEDVVVENYLRLTISSPEAKHLTRSNPPVARMVTAMSRDRTTRRASTI